VAVYADLKRIVGEIIEKDLFFRCPARSSPFFKNAARPRRISGSIRNYIPEGFDRRIYVF